MKILQVAFIGWLLIIAALGFYGYGVWEAVRLSVSDQPIKQGDYPEIISTTVSSINAILLTNLGILIGISLKAPQSGIANAMMLQRGGIRLNALTSSPLELKDKIQIAAALIYIISLLICVIVWVYNKFSTDPDQVLSTVSESGKMFIGVFLAYISTILSTK